MRKTPLALLVVAVLGLAPVAHAGVNIIDYQGYAWETGGFVPSNANDVLNIVGITDSADAIFGVNLGTEELTIYVTDLVSTGQAAFGGGVIGVNYLGGTIEVWRDPTMNHSYGINPPNGTAPSTFTDGSLLLSGFLTSFVLYFDTVHGVGSYEGYVTWTGGSALGAINGIQNDGFTFGGVLSDAAASGTVPDGYDLQADGVIEVYVIVGVEKSTWSGVKSLYQN
jgi:hypothetical protein